MRKTWMLLLTGALLMGGCTDLDVTNPNNPDRERVVSNPDDLQSLISSQMVRLFRNNQFNYPNGALAAMVDNTTGGFLDYSVAALSWEPREAWNNSSLNTRSAVNRQPWYGLYEIISASNDGLQAIDGGVEITSGSQDNTARAEAFAKLLQGLAHGYLGLLFDQALVISEDRNLEEMELTAFLPYQEVTDSAIAMIDEAIAIMEANEFTIPGSADWINGQEMSSDELARLANSYAARFIAHSARTWEERAAVDWEEVIRRIDAGITEDFAPDGLLESWESDHRRLLARVRSRPGDHWRMDYFALGPADTTGQFQEWANAPSEERLPFQIETTDRRIQGAEPDDPGKYFAYDVDENTIFSSSRGTYRWSYYYYHRMGVGESWYIGPQPTMTVTEMNLLKAEALIRLDRAEEAVPLINDSRVNNGELPPVTVDGPPAGDSCVPRQIDGDCGSLWDAWKHEVHTEFTAIESQMMYYWLRGNLQMQ
ncbi:MAG TPA: hypothetical protein VK966_04365, partial [Longimicrobiales bacterium]|nr:hypothetical protein [Longimicrobiales bacterium]